LTLLNLNLITALDGLSIIERGQLPHLDERNALKRTGLLFQAAESPATLEDACGEP
jgi:hypothetical protein